MVRKVDMSTELQILAFHEQRKAGGPMGEPVKHEYIEAVEA
jgi:redox-sensing transcriptional repressor